LVCCLIVDTTVLSSQQFGVLKVVKTAAKRAGIIETVTPHILRHSFAGK